MARRSHSFLGSASLVSFAFVVATACSSDDSNSTDSASATTAPGTTTGTATQTSTVGTASVTNTVTTTASATTATSSSTGSASTTDSVTTASATTGSTTGSATTGSTTAGAGGTSSTSSGAGGAGGTSTTGGSTEFALTSPAFADDGMCSNEMPDTCELFPSANSSFVGNENPELNWTPGPAGTLSYALVFHDLSNGFGHWAVWGLSAETLQLPAALPGDATLTTPIQANQVNASFAQGNGYFGPGSCSNVYEFKLYALNIADYTPANASTPDMIQDELEGPRADIVLDAVTLRGRANPEDSTMACP